ncbi:MAG: amidophosphoribosyltransferase [Syntrophales bacterium]|nr:amidophosphoribosyltransferase [Syntrophales bacterium]
MGGLFGVVSNQNCSKVLFYGTDYHSHLGTENGGMAIFGEQGFYQTIHSISQAQFKSKFIADYREMSGNMGIGSINNVAPQPLIVRSKFGTYAIAASGLITNKDTLAEGLLRQGVSFSEMAGGGVNPVELVARLINRGETLLDGIVNMQKLIEGSLCLLILKDDGIYAARDLCGRFSLVVGGNGKKGEYVIATEASALQNLGYDVMMSPGPGEILKLSRSGIKQLRPPSAEKKVCAFLWIYTGEPSSTYEGKSVEIARECCGRALARKDRVKADFVTGIPDSGIGHAVGYAQESGIPYKRPLVKYTPGYGRSYTPPSQEIRDLVATMKIIAVREVIRGNRMVVCDDSIVRGGAKEIHLRVACPPLMYPCIYGSSTRTKGELAARRAIRTLCGKDPESIAPYLNAKSKAYREMVEWIRNDLNVTSLKYLTIDEMIEAIGLPEKDLCLYCWRGC